MTVEKDKVKGLAQYGYYLDPSKTVRKIQDEIPLSREELKCLEKKWGDKIKVLKEEHPRIVFFNLGETNPRSSPGEE